MQRRRQLRPPPARVRPRRLQYRNTSQRPVAHAACPSQHPALHPAACRLQIDPLEVQEEWWSKADKESDKDMEKRLLEFLDQVQHAPQVMPRRYMRYMRYMRRR